MCKYLVMITLIFSSLMAQEAPGRPGYRPNWASAKKVNVGTTYSGTDHNSYVWFTNAKGILTEVFYPTMDKAQIKDSQLLITGKGKFWEEKTDTIQKVEVLSPKKLREEIVQNARDMIKVYR